MLDRAHRLLRSSDFRSVTRRGTKSASTFVAVYAAPNDRGLCRFGIITSKAVGNAPTRNKLRRQYRAIASEVPDALSLDIVLRVLPEAASAKWDELRDDAFARISEVKLDA